jgi:hypothetical protein
MGELQALDWTHIELDANLLRVERSWDRTGGFIQPKRRSGGRRVPITNTLRTHLLAHRLQQGTAGHGLVFPNHPGHKPFNPATTNNRAKHAWAKAGLHPITLHECRHSCAAYTMAAGINTKALSTYMGHASITITLDRYGHLLLGNEHHAATLLNNWLEDNKAPSRNHSGHAPLDALHGREGDRSPPDHGAAGQRRCGQSTRHSTSDCGGAPAVSASRFCSRTSRERSSSAIRSRCSTAQYGRRRSAARRRVPEKRV